MKKVALYTILVLGFSFCATSQLAYGQRFGTVQLPVYRQFSMGTSVLVPDRGSVYAGGVGSAAMTRRNGLRTSGVNAGGVTVSAYIHDLEAMDAALIEQGRLARLRKGQAALKVAPSRSQRVAKSSPKIGELRARTKTKQNADFERARRDYDLAARLMSKGKEASARILLKSAFRRADAELQAQITSRLAAIDRTTR